jgi:hypothetical protein
MTECDGRRLLAIRDKAIDATKGIVVAGKIVGHPVTPEERAKNVEYGNAMLQVGGVVSE